MKGPHISAHAVIGGNETLLPRINIGSRALIAEGSVVTRDVEPGVVVAGNPAIVKGSVYDIECTTGLADFPYPR